MENSALQSISVVVEINSVRGKTRENEHRRHLTTTTHIGVSSRQNMEKKSWTIKQHRSTDVCHSRRTDINQTAYEIGIVPRSSTINRIFSAYVSYPP